MIFKKSLYCILVVFVMSCGREADNNNNPQAKLESRSYGDLLKHPNGIEPFSADNNNNPQAKFKSRSYGDLIKHPDEIDPYSNVYYFPLFSKEHPLNENTIVLIKKREKEDDPDYVPERATAH